MISDWPFWTRGIGDDGTVTLTFTVEQASALARDVRRVVRESPLDLWTPRLDELAHRLIWDADYLRRRERIDARL